MSFSSLPPELVHQVLESNAPHTFRSTTYEDRQFTLCRLSLVSKQFHSIAQPLLFAMVKLKDLGDARKIHGVRAQGGSTRLRSPICQLFVEWDDTIYDDWSPQEKDQIVESLRVFETVTSLTAVDIAPRNFEALLSMLGKHLTYLQLSGRELTKPNGSIRLPNLRDLTLFHVPRQLLVALVDPVVVPNLRNFAFHDTGLTSAGDLADSKLNELLPQLDTLTIAASVWLDPRAAFVYSAASRTLVDFSSHNIKELDPVTATLVHVRLQESTPANELFSYDKLEAQLDRWSAIIQHYRSLSLKSLYIDSSLANRNLLPPATQASLATLVRICNEHKIDLVFELLDVYYCDPAISSEFIRRQKEERIREGVAQGGSRS